MQSKILVMGGTGMVGSELVNQLSGTQANFSVLVRRKEAQQQLEAKGIQTTFGVMGDDASMADALRGVDTVFLLSSPAPEMLELHKGVIDQAVAAGVRKIVRLSAEPARYAEGMPLYEQHAEADKYLMKSGLAYAILRPHYFMQNIALMHTHSILEQKMFAQFLGDARIPMVDVRDIAMAAVKCLIEDKFDGKIHYITGPRPINYEQVADAFSNALGETIQYVPLSYADQKQGFVMGGVPQWNIDTVMTVFMKWVDAQVSEASPDFQAITKQPARDIKEYVQDTVANMQQPAH